MPSESPGGAEGTFRHALRALGHRNYRLFFAGQSISLIGTWLTRVATAWLVYRLTGSALDLGVITFCGQIPTFFIAPFAGVLVDRSNRHRILLATQVLSMAQSFALAWLALSGVITVWEVAALSVVQGLVNAFDTPARQAFVIEMVEDRADLPSAIALNSSMVNAARLLGPSFAGLLIAAFGEGGCFLIDGFSYVAVIASLLAMRLAETPRPRTEKRVLGELKEGVLYAIRSPPIRAVLLLMALTSLMGVPYMTLMPIMASKVLHGDAHTFGFLTAGAGLGALVAAGYLASRRTVVGLGRVIAATTAVFGLSLIAFALSRSVPVSLTLMLGTGFGMMAALASTNTILQTIVEDRMRGRVMSFYTMAFMGTAPFGSLFAGLMADRFGAPITIVIGGTACCLGAALFFTRLPELRKHVRPIYARLGILPEIAEGLGEASRLMTPPEE